MHVNSLRRILGTPIECGLNNGKISLAGNKLQCQIPSSKNCPLSAVPDVKDKLEFNRLLTSIPHHLHIRNSYYWAKNAGGWSQLNSTLLLLSIHNAESTKIFIVPIFQKISTIKSLLQVPHMHPKFCEHTTKDTIKACITFSICNL